MVPEHLASPSSNGSGKEVLGVWHPSSGAAAGTRGFGRDLRRCRRQLPTPTPGALGEGKGRAPPAHLLTVKCGHLPSRFNASP